MHKWSKAIVKGIIVGGKQVSFVNGTNGCKAHPKLWIVASFGEL